MIICSRNREISRPIPRLIRPYQARDHQRPWSKLSSMHEASLWSSRSCQRFICPFRICRHTPISSSTDMPVEILWWHDATRSYQRALRVVKGESIRDTTFVDAEYLEAEDEETEFIPEESLLLAEPFDFMRIFPLQDIFDRWTGSLICETELFPADGKKKTSCWSPNTSTRCNKSWQQQTGPRSLLASLINRWANGIWTGSCNWMRRCFI